MTALNLFCQDNYAFMLTDTAATDLDGLVISTRPKALLLIRARMAICWTGFAPMPLGGSPAATNWAGYRVKAALRAQGLDPEHAPQAAILAAMPRALRMMHVENINSMPGATPEMMSLTVGIALWNDQRGPMVVMGQTEDVGDLPAYSFARVHNYLTTDKGDNTASFVAKALGRSAHLADSRDFDARRDGLALLEAQRRLRTSYSGLDHHAVGGRAILIAVSRRGVSNTVLWRWRDRIGEAINPESGPDDTITKFMEARCGNHR